MCNEEQRAERKTTGTERGTWQPGRSESDSDGGGPLTVPSRLPTARLFSPRSVCTALFSPSFLSELHKQLELDVRPTTDSLPAQPGHPSAEDPGRETIRPFSR